MASKTYILSILNDSGENLWFDVFSYNQNLQNMTRISNSTSEAISNGNKGTFTWPLNLKAKYDPNIVFYVTATDNMPIVGLDVSTARRSLTFSFPPSVFVSAVKYSLFTDLSDIQVQFNCTCAIASTAMRTSSQAAMGAPTKESLPKRGAMRGVANPQVLWESGETLKIRFKRGQCDEVVRFAIMTMAKKWLEKANLFFEELDDFLVDWPAGYSVGCDIYIGFEPNHPFGANWSLIGKECREAAEHGQLSMNLCFCTDRCLTHNPDIFFRTVLHEFGHALGLNHEHQSPVEGGVCISIDKVKIYRANNLWQNWPLEAIYENFGVLDPKRTVDSQFFDDESIMNYDIPLEIQYNPINLADGRQKNGKKWPPRKVVKKTYALSEDDVDFMAFLYDFD